MALELTATVLLLVALGAHVIVPGRLDRTREASSPLTPRLWALIPPLLLASATIAGVEVLARRSLALAAADAFLHPAVLRALAVLLPALLLLDLLVVWAHEQLPRSGLELAAGFSVLALVAGAAALELILGVERAPEAGLGPLLIAVVVRVVVALGAGEAVSPAGPGKRPLWGTPAGLLLPLYLLVLPPHDRAALGPAEGAALALAIPLFVVARWLPARLRRIALAVATLAAATFLLRAAGLAATVPAPVGLEPLPPLPLP